MRSPPRVFCRQHSIRTATHACANSLQQSGKRGSGLDEGALARKATEMGRATPAGVTPTALTSSYPRVQAIVDALFLDRRGRAWLRRLMRAGRRRGAIEASDLLHDVAQTLLEADEDASTDAASLDEQVLRAVVQALAGRPLDRRLNRGDGGLVAVAQAA